MKSLMGGVLCLALAGCASAPIDYYRLGGDPDARPPAAAEVGISVPTVEIGPVVLPAYLDRPQLVLNDDGHHLRVLEHSRWAAPLPQLAAGTLAADLARALPHLVVYPYPQPAPQAPDLQVVLQVDALQAVPGQGVRLEGGWTVRRAGRVAAAGRFDEQAAAAGNSLDALVAAHDRALAALADRLAPTLRRLAD